MVKKAVKQSKKSATALDSSAVSTTLPPYTQKESEYRALFLKKLEDTRTLRESPHDKLNGVGYKTWYEQNDKAANSHTPPRKNPEDVNIVTGTTREKVLAIVSNVINLVLRTNFKAFDKDDNEAVELGEAMSDCVERSAQVELWEEKKLYPYYEMAAQGDVFVEDIEVDEVKVDKKKIKLSSVKDESIFDNFEPEKTLKTMFSGCRRNVLIGTQVYFGNIYETDFSKQPYVFTREVLPYESAKVIYGNLPRWKYVPRTIMPALADTDNQWGINWRLEDIPDGQVEIIKYTDDVNDEYQIVINGVPQLPFGFPKPWEFDGYNIVQGGLEPMGMFAYHKSIPCKTKVDQEILDEMLRLSVLKGKKSYMPPIANYSGQILSRSMFGAGKVLNNLQKGDIEVVGGNASMYSLNNGEFQLIEMLKRFIDEKSVNPMMQGISPSRETTATEVSTVTAQAKRNLGIMIFGFMSFQLKLDLLRLNNLLDGYTKPVGDKLDALKEKLVKKYRTVTLEKEIGSKGKGIKKIEFTTDYRSPMDIYDEQNGIVRDKETKKPLSVNPPEKPIKIIQVNPELLRSVKYRWYGEVEINEKETSMQERIIFTDQLATAMKLFGMESINMDYAKAQWAQKNKVNAKLFFNNGVALPGQMMNSMQEEVNKVEESPATKQMRSSPSGVPAAVRQGFGNT